MEGTCVSKIYTEKGIAKDNVFPGLRVLHLGCGNAKLQGAVGVDVLDLPSVDVVYDLDVAPWPFDDNSFDVVFVHSILEHADNVVSFLNEVWRVGAPGARVVIAVPYFRSVDSFTDPTHKHFFTSRSLDYFCDTHNALSGYGYTDKRFKKIGFWYGWPRVSANPFVRIFKHLITRRQGLYDQYLSLIFPVKIVIWELEVKK